MSDSANTTSEAGLDCSGVFCDLGDVGFENLSAQQSKERIEAIRTSAMAAISMGHKLISIGGDHSISYPLIQVGMSMMPSCSCASVLLLGSCTHVPQHQHKLSLKKSSENYIDAKKKIAKHASAIVLDSIFLLRKIGSILAFVLLKHSAFQDKTVVCM